MKSLFFILLTAVITSAATTLVAPRYLSWYATPPVPIGVSCDPAISWAMDSLVMWQLAGLAAGLVLGTVIAFRLKKAPSATPAAPVPPNP